MLLNARYGIGILNRIEHGIVYGMFHRKKVFFNIRLYGTVEELREP